MTITGDTGSYIAISALNLAEDIRKLSFTQLLDYRNDLKNPNLSYADNRNKRDLLILVDEEINIRMKR